MLLDEIRWSAPLLSEVPVPKELEIEAKRIAKRVPPYLSIMAPSPWTARLFLIPEGYRSRVHVTRAEMDIVALVTAQENACRFCYGMQRASMRVAGYSEHRIQQIERNVDLGDEHVRALAGFCRQLAQSNPRPARTEREGLQRLGYSPEHVRELVFEIALGCMFHRFTTLFAAPPVQSLESMPGKWWSIFLRPLFIHGMSPKKATPVEDPGTGPWGAMIAGLNGTASPPVLRSLVQQFCASSALPMRTKLLMLAVISRALGCPLCELNAVEMLASEGLSREDTVDALDAMQSPKLTPLEAKLLPFARATVRYEPYRIQERTAELLREIGTEQAIEVVGVAGMGNMLVRLAMLLAP